MQATREPGGVWIITTDPDDSQQSGSRFHREALERYLNAFDCAFVAAAGCSEFEFIQSAILRVRGLQGPGWDPYQTTIRAIDALVKIHEGIEKNNAEGARHLRLWIYGHIVEAAEPYEILANLIDVALGGRFLVSRFPNRGRTATYSGRPQTPGEKIAQIEAAAEAAGIPQVAIPLREVWDRELRNAVFHADYSFHGPELRLFDPVRVYPIEDELRLVNRALAYHEALKALIDEHRASYTEPRQIPVPPGYSDDPDEIATIMVKDGRGVIGLKDSWTREQLVAGKVPFCLGRFTPRDAALRIQDPTLARFPAEDREEETNA